MSWIKINWYIRRSCLEQDANLRDVTRIVIGHPGTRDPLPLVLLNYSINCVKSDFNNSIRFKHRFKEMHQRILEHSLHVYQNGIVHSCLNQVEFF